MPEDDVYQPVLVGVGTGNAPVSGYLHDYEDDNISVKNHYYCELTGLYWILKNVQAEYFGICHYRRYGWSSLLCLQYVLHEKNRIMMCIVPEQRYDFLGEGVV